MLLPLTTELDVLAITMVTASEAGTSGWGGGDEKVGSGRVSAVGTIGNLGSVLIISDQNLVGHADQPEQRRAALSLFCPSPPDPMPRNTAVYNLLSLFWILPLSLLVLSLFRGHLLLYSYLKCWSSPEL